ncbi:WcbI family polysaccharide biosynthesis putative acetyltransferase [Sphingomonas sp. RB3P16]|uniref:WcbI family polysaccharide biosynthesis putative acetyltransferase n=1 Tax=Parasphingomonas frigoris TaxID=3096163 RepID=UPI002FC8DAB9
MSRNIVVTSNCQTGGLAAALQVIFPRDSIRPMPINLFDRGGEFESNMNVVRGADIWVTSAAPELLEFGPDGPQVVRTPTINFEAFHPDIGYVLPAAQKAPIEPHYNSLIAVWAYVNGLDVKDAAKLFNHNAFRDLGYLSAWEHQAEQLQSDFVAAGVDFSRFFLFAKRQGAFMYSVNHPTADVLVFLAKQLSLKMGESEAIFDRDIKIPDGLASLIWPIYPDIAQYYSLQGSYCWKLSDGHYLTDLPSYLEWAYGNMEQHRLEKNLIVLRRPIAELDQVLFNNFKMAA